MFSSNAPTILAKPILEKTQIVDRERAGADILGT